MASNLSIQDALTANEVVSANTDVSNSEFNPLPQTSKVSLFAAATTAGTGGRGTLVTFQIGNEVKCRDFVAPVASAVSTRDHLVATGVGMRGTKFTLGYRNEGTATPTLNAYIVIEPL